MSEQEKKPIFHNDTLPEIPGFNGTMPFTPETLKQMLLDMGLDMKPGTPYEVLQPCATEEEREQLRDAVGQLYYEGNFTDGFTLKVRKF